VVGFAGRRGWSTVLADSTWNVTGKAAQPEAPLVTAEEALAPEMDARLVRIDALVLSVSRISQHTTFALQSGDRVFLARLADSAARPPPAVTEGSWVRLSGVCVQTPLEDGWGAPGTATPAGTGDAPSPGRPPSFYLLLASDKAVQVISAPGWWTLRRVLVVCGILAAVAVASTVWVVALRRRVARQTRTIREHLAKRALYEERVRIARDLHDSLEQDLLGITMQLNATEKLLAHPDRARQALHLAAAMVRRSQAETHRAVWDLREQRSGADGLVSAIREAAAGLQAPRAPADSAGDGAAERAGGDAAPDRPRVEVRAVGDPRPLPPQVENHILRVALEAVTNAVKHSGASVIEVEVTFAADRVEVLVRDDGRGFDAERLPPPSSGHFGLFGMRERAEKLGGALTIRSRPGGGAEIRIVVDTGGDPARPTRERATAEAVTS
jgi:signal transduction histidine kinase